ncbi:MAG: SGNH/GDSL hydrolase family protein [Verrucomicrobiota bacterium]|nr:SGNH/GDSL hydrolase family protein [Verrucomicrobiota bacterium]
MIRPTRLSVFVTILLLAFGQAAGAETNRNVTLRGGLQNARIQFEQKLTGRVAFIGGSITQMKGYRPMVSDWLQARFPETKFEFINAGISSTDSQTGAFRLGDHVLAKGRIDLLFVEFAVNDDQDAQHSRRGCILGIEGIIRQMRLRQPLCDLVVTHFVNPSMLQQIQSGQVPTSIDAHEVVLRHYNVSSVYLAREVAERIADGKLTWAQYGGTHPKPTGNTVAAELIGELLGRDWAKPLPTGAAKGAPLIPAKPLDAGSFFNGKFLSPGLVKRGNSWSWHVPEWRNIPGSFRQTFATLKLLCGSSDSGGVSFEFEGRAVGAYVLAGPDAGVLEVSLDGGPFEPSNLYHRFSRGLHYPRTVMFATDLAPGLHAVRLRLAKPPGDGAKRTAARILQFVVN